MWNNVGARHEVELLLAMFRHLRLQITPDTIFATDLERTRKMIHFLVRTDCFEAGTLHVFTPNAHPVVGFCKKKKEDFEFSISVILMNKNPRSENSLFNNRKPEFTRIFRMTIGVMVVSFHFRTFVTAAGIGGPFSSCDANVMYGGTCGNRLDDRGPVAVLRPWTQSAIIVTFGKRDRSIVAGIPLGSVAETFCCWI